MRKCSTTFENSPTILRCGNCCWNATTKQHLAAYCWNLEPKLGKLLWRLVPIWISEEIELRNGKVDVIPYFLCLSAIYSPWTYMVSKESLINKNMIVWSRVWSDLSIKQDLRTALNFKVSNELVHVKQSHTSCLAKLQVWSKIRECPSFSSDIVHSFHWTHKLLVFTKLPSTKVT